MPTADAVRFNRARIVDEFGDATLLEYLQMTSRADDGRDPSVPNRPVVTDGGRPADIDDDDDDDDEPKLHVGDHVADRGDDEESVAPMLVVGLPPTSAAEYVVGDDDQTVADYNAAYPPADDVVEVVYPQRTDVALRDKQRYAFPRSRLRLVTPIHDIDGHEPHRLADAEPRRQPSNGGDTITDDDGNEVPRRSEPADFGGGESTGVQKL